MFRGILTADWLVSALNPAHLLDCNSLRRMNVRPEDMLRYGVGNEYLRAGEMLGLATNDIATWDAHIPFVAGVPVHTYHKGRIRSLDADEREPVAGGWEVPQSILQRISAGATTMPRADIVAKIAKAHGTTSE